MEMFQSSRKSLSMKKINKKVKMADNLGLNGLVVSAGK